MKNKKEKHLLISNSNKRKRKKQDKIRYKENNFTFSTDIVRRSGYKYKKEHNKKYRYLFTNYKLFYYIYRMDANVYLIFTTLIAMLLSDGMNTIERKLLFSIFIDIGDAMRTIVIQDNIVEDVNNEASKRAEDAALQYDLDAIFAELERLRHKKTI